MTSFSNEGRFSSPLHRAGPDTRKARTFGLSLAICSSTKPRVQGAGLRATQGFEGPASSLFHKAVL